MEAVCQRFESTANHRANSITTVQVKNSFSIPMERHTHHGALCALIFAYSNAKMHTMPVSTKPTMPAILFSFSENGQGIQRAPSPMIARTAMNKIFLMEREVSTAPLSSVLDT